MPASISLLVMGAQRPEVGAAVGMWVQVLDRASEWARTFLLWLLCGHRAQLE